MLQKIIEEIIQPLLVGQATWVERYGGLVQTLEVKVTIDPEKGTQQVQKWPIACDVNQEECNSPNDTYDHLVPDDSKASILYFEEVQPMSFGGFVGNTQGNVWRNWQQWSGRVRLVVWLNAARLGIGEQNGNYSCDWSYPFIDQLLQLINVKGKATSGSFDGGNYEIRPSGLVRKDLGIFSKYTYNKYKNYYRYPFDYFAIDFDVFVKFCTGKNTTIPSGDVINCPFNQVDTPLLNEYSMFFDGVDEYQLVPASESLSFGNGATDTPLTFSIWLKWLSTGSNSWVFGKRGLIVTNQIGEYQVVISPTNNSIELDLFDDSQNGRITGITTNLTPPQGQWANVVFTYDGSGLANGIKCYINSIEAPLTYSTINNYVAMERNDDIPLYIGIANFSQSGLIFPYRGNLDEISFWDAEFNQTEVNELYNNGLPTKLQQHSKASNLVYWNRQGDNGDNWDGSKWNLLDNSNNTNNGTSVNMEEIDRQTDVPT